MTVAEVVKRLEELKLVVIPNEGGGIWRPICQLQDTGWFLWNLHSGQQVQVYEHNWQVEGEANPAYKIFSIEPIGEDIVQEVRQLMNYMHAVLYDHGDRDYVAPF